jgi:putative membrane protein
MVAMAAGETATAVLPGINGFLGTRASFGMDVVVVGLFALLPVLALSIVMVRQGRYRIHKALQIFIMLALLAAIVIFEIDIRLISDWRVRAAVSRYWPVGVGVALGIHLIFAVSTLGLLLWVFIEALLRFPQPPLPGSHSPRHRRLAWWAAADLLATAITGGIFYCLAFV